MIDRPSRRPRLASVATAFPEHAVDRTVTTNGLLSLFPKEDADFVRNLVERSGVERRLMAIPPEEILTTRAFSARQAQYLEIAVRLATDACQKALSRASVPGDAIDVIIDVSCTGVVLPALDVHLAPLLGLRPDVKRVPITESGCAGGTLALGIASNFAAAGLKTLLVAVELCSVALVQGDATRTNLIASVLFGDGAGACVITPDGEGPEIRAVGSHLFRDTRAVMGFDIGEHGLRLILQRELPLILERGLRDAVVGFLTRHHRTPADIGLHLVHPGGRRVLEGYATMFGITADDLRFSWEALRTYGNLSSAAILSVLDLAVSRDALPRDGRETFLISFGPGLSAEMLILSSGGA